MSLTRFNQQAMATNNSKENADDGKGNIQVLDNFPSLIVLNYRW